MRPAERLPLPEEPASRRLRVAPVPPEELTEELGDQDLIEDGEGLEELNPEDVYLTNPKEVKAYEDIQSAPRQFNRLRKVGERQRANMRSASDKVRAAEEKKLAQLRSDIEVRKIVGERPLPPAPVFERAQVHHPDGKQIPRADAYRRVADRLRAISAELQGLEALPHKYKRARQYEAELNAEYEELQEWMIRAEEQEGINPLVDNPFYRRDPDTAGFEGLSQEQLQVRYQELRTRNTQLNRAIEELEAREKDALELVGSIHETTSMRREKLHAKRSEALNQLTGQRFTEEEEQIAATEGRNREGVQGLNISKELSDIQRELDQLIKQKGQVLVELSNVAERLESWNG